MKENINIINDLCEEAAAYYYYIGNNTDKVQTSYFYDQYL